MPAKLKILHVEDDIDVQEITKIALQLSDRFELVQCLSAAEALDVAAQYCPDILLLDVMMPDMTGDALLAKLRELPNYSEIPAIFMTARAHDSEVAALKKAGGISVIIKPFDPMTLGDAILSETAI
ncbi:response regulator [Aquicoccus sp. G2-2]|jgi:CheY-like chemotaxis protein|uniref:response regulator n=1 Tax=Aquicoccus sp. G2-2 TaxID=3092120 RepID=UPI002ADFF6DE|nr:response regulator [Aquicoccus sp. G2-2]MEA1113946.1 response regulator [Aquicoccus sp. G2-2]